jgi:hypothetical protein
MSISYFETRNEGAIRETYQVAAKSIAVSRIVSLQIDLRDGLLVGRGKGSFQGPLVHVGSDVKEHERLKEM